MESLLANLGKQKSGLLQNHKVGATESSGAHFMVLVSLCGDLVVCSHEIRSTVVHEIGRTDRGVQQAPAYHPIVGVLHLFVGVGHRMGIA